jgi:hypothetical protein
MSGQPPTIHLLPQRPQMEAAYEVRVGPRVVTPPQGPIEPPVMHDFRQRELKDASNDGVVQNVLQGIADAAVGVNNHRALADSLRAVANYFDPPGPRVRAPATFTPANDLKAVMRYLAGIANSKLMNPHIKDNTSFYSIADTNRKLREGLARFFLGMRTGGIEMCALPIEPTNSLTQRKRYDRFVEFYADRLVYLGGHVCPVVERTLTEFARGSSGRTDALRHVKKMRSLAAEYLTKYKWLPPFSVTFQHMIASAKPSEQVRMFGTVVLSPIECIRRYCGDNCLHQMSHSTCKRAISELRGVRARGSGDDDMNRIQPGHSLFTLDMPRVSQCGRSTTISTRFWVQTPDDFHDMLLLSVRKAGYNARCAVPFEEVWSKLNTDTKQILFTFKQGELDQMGRHFNVKNVNMMKARLWTKLSSQTVPAEENKLRAALSSRNRSVKRCLRDGASNGSSSKSVSVTGPDFNVTYSEVIKVIRMFKVESPTAWKQRGAIVDALPFEVVVPFTMYRMMWLFHRSDSRKLGANYIEGLEHKWELIIPAVVVSGGVKRTHSQVTC